MENLALQMNLINDYNKLAYTHNYIYGFFDKKNVVVAYADEKIMPYISCIDKASSKNGGGCSLRFKPNAEQKELLKVNCKTFVLCSKEYFERLYNNSRYNRGEIFEKLMTEYYSQEWVKDNIPFTDGPDLVGDGIPYQAKFEKATFGTETSLKNLKRKKGIC